MGMAAGQARLLSITARLTDNELRSQTITNSKLRLADKSTEVSQEYMDALNSTQLMYGAYDGNGNLSYQELTANSLLSYGELKNQYSLVNSNGQIMLNGSDIKKYEASNSLAEFLYSYGIPEVENPKWVEALQGIYGTTTNTDGSYVYETLYDETNPSQWNDYFSAMTDSDIANLQNIVTKDPTQVTASDAQKVTDAVNSWKSQVTGNTLLQDYANMGGSFGAYVNELLNPPAVPFPNENDYRSEEGTELAHKFEIASYPCYNNAMNSSSSTTCYVHVLTHLLDLKSTDITDTAYNGKPTVPSSWGNTYTTTAGGYTVTTSENDITGSAIQSAREDKDHNPVNGLTNSMASVSEYLCKDEDGDGQADVLAPATGPTITASSPLVDKLLSNYKIDASGQMVQKTFKEKTIDLLYVIQHFNDADMKKADGTNYTYNELKVYLQNFQTDMMTTLNRVTEEYYEAIRDWQNEIGRWLKQVGDLKATYVEDLENIPDKTIPDEKDARYQWYVNLYYRMGGGAENADGTKNNNNYKELDENLINNAEWLQFALEHGILTMEQASYNENGSEKYPEIGTYDWTSIIYTNAADIKSQEDDVKIAAAEVKYKKALTEIENQDKKFDQDLKKLDTEHNALQTEYESLKSTIDKNVERSFKVFS